jgi:FkbM family methyltransferase
VAGFTVRTDGETSLAAEESATLGQNAFHDMRKLARSEPELLIMDVGANCGQTISDFRNTFENPVIHAFEPGRKAFSQLQRWTAEIPNLHLNNFAVGSRSGQMEFIENRQSVMSSFFEPGVDCSGIINERRQVQVMTLADYCATEGITHIDILKSDTQGFDLEVIKGAGWLLERRRIHLIYLEIIFSEMYKGLPGLDDIYRFLVSHGFRLVSFYQFYYEHNRASWTDALFTNPGFEAPNLNPTGPNGRTARAL